MDTSPTMVTTLFALVIRILNLKYSNCVLNKGTLVGTCNEISWMRSYQDLSNSNKHEDAKMNMLALLDDCQNGLSNVELLKAHNLLLNSISIFSTHDGYVGRTGVIQHKIDIGRTVPI